MWVHGSGEQPRLNYGPVVAPLVGDGVAVFSYDKRGVAAWEGDCCARPGEYDLVRRRCRHATVIRSHSEIDPNKVSLLQRERASWGGAIGGFTTFQACCFHGARRWPGGGRAVRREVWSNAAGEEDEGPLTAEKKAEATQKLQEAGPSGFDPAPLIEHMSTPGLWLYGGADKSIPTDRSVEILTQMKRAGMDFTIVVFPNAGHGLVDYVPTAPRSTLDSRELDRDDREGELAPLTDGGGDDSASRRRQGPSSTLKGAG